MDWGRSHLAHLARRVMERLTHPGNHLRFRGVLHIHSTPSAMRQHINWAIQSVLGAETMVNWSLQPKLPGTYRAKLEYRNLATSGAQIASALRGWHFLNFEIVECGENIGEMFRYTPELGMHRAQIDQSGAILITENQLSNILKTSLDDQDLREGINQVIGTAWELELERFRAIGHEEIASLRAI